MKILLIIFCILVSSCFVPEPVREGRHHYKCLDTIQMEKYELIRFKCQDPDCYKIDSFKLYRQ